MHHVDVGGVTFGNNLPLVLISGPCQLESADHAQMIAMIELLFVNIIIMSILNY